MISPFAYEYLRVFSAKCQKSCEFVAARLTDTRTSSQPLDILAASSRERGRSSRVRGGKIGMKRDENEWRWMARDREE